MCTATWTRRPDSGYEFLFNRDELLTRAEAEPPRAPRSPTDRRDGVRWLAPTDGDFGGTWISVNEAGLALGLLNGFRPADDEAPPGLRSRGLLVSDLASSPGLLEVEARLAAADLARHRSFRLLALAPGAPALLAEWDRERLVLDRTADGRRPVVSSSFRESAVGEARRREYVRVTGEAPGEPAVDDLLRYHRSAPGGPSALTVAMRRPDAETRSFTRIRVGPAEVELRYAPGLPRAGAPETALRLPLIRVPSTTSSPPPKPEHP
jgi:hypothetical protein